MERDPPLVVVCYAVGRDPDGRPPGVYDDHELIFEGEKPDPKVVARLTRKRSDGAVPLLIVIGPEEVAPPPDEPE